MYNAIINVFLIVSLLLVRISTCYQPNKVTQKLTNRVRFNGRDSHDVITYNCANYVSKSMVEKKTEHISVHVSFYYVNKIIIYPTRLEAAMPALNFLH